MRKELKVKSEWESLTWFLDDKKIEQPNQIKEAIVQGVKYKIKWRELIVPYDDMGHRCFAKSWHGFLIVDENMQAEASIYYVIHTQKKKVWVEDEGEEGV